MMAQQGVERFYKITADGSDAVKALNDIAAATASVDKRLADFSKGLKDLKKDLIGAFGAHEIKEGVLRIVENMSKIVDESAKLGVSTEEFQKLSFAAKQSGVSAEALATNIKKLQQGMAALNDPTSKQGQLLKQMGVSAGDTVTQALGKVGDSLKNVLDEGKKVAIINEAISKSANQMLPMLEKGTEGLDEFATTAEK